MHNIKLKLVKVAIAMAFMPILVNAATLGKLTINSNVGEPLNAEIELTAAKDELASITANIATEEAYQLQGIQRSPLLKDVSMNFGRRSDGSMILKLASQQPFTSSPVDILIVLNTLGGRALNEYTMYLPQSTSNQITPSTTNIAAITTQPPIVSAPSIYKESPPIRTQPQISNSDANNSAATPFTTKTLPVAPNYVPQTVGRSAPETKNSGYIVRPGDSLNKIAQKIPLQEFSYEQLLVGLFKNNESAFYDNNMNRLRAGKLINTPIPSVIKAIPQYEAVQTIAEQMHEYKAWLTGEESAKPSNVASGKINKTGPVLTLSMTKLLNVPKDAAEKHNDPNPSKGTAPSATKPDNLTPDEVIADSEELIAKNHELEDAKSRIAALEKQIKDMQTLMAMKSQVAAAEDNKSFENVLVKAKDNPMLAGGVLGGIGLLSVFGIMRRKKESNADQTGSVDVEIEREMAELKTATPSFLGTPGDDDVG